MINVGIIGCGFVGGALKDWLEHNNPDCKLFISDPAKGYNDDMSEIDIKEQTARIDKLRKEIESDQAHDEKPYGVLLMPPIMPAIVPPNEDENDG